MTIMTTISVAKVYLRSIVGIVSTSAGIVAYGVYVAPVGDQVLLGWLAVCGAMVLFDKPKIEAEADDD